MEGDLKLFEYKAKMGGYSVSGATLYRRVGPAIGWQWARAAGKAGSWFEPAEL